MLTKIYFKLVRSKRKTIALSITREASIVVRAPIRTPLSYIARMVEKKSSWIEKGIRKMRAFPPPTKRRNTKQEYLKFKETARLLVHARIGELNKYYGFRYGKISIRNQKSRWGSCSKNGNLSFNYRIALLPPALADYLLVHELCHLREMNHSPRFWALVEKTIPHYRILRRELHQKGMTF